MSRSSKDNKIPQIPLEDRSLQTTTYKGIKEMMAAISPEIRESVEQSLAKRNITRHLFTLRCSRSLTQKDVADKLGCSQSRISKIESSDDDDLRLGDLRQFLAAVDLDLVLMFCPKKKPRIIDRIRMHADSIKNLLSQIVRLSKGDPHMCDGAMKAHIKTMEHITQGIIESAKTLPKFHAQKTDFITPADADSESFMEVSDSHTSLAAH